MVSPVSIICLTKYLDQTVFWVCYITNLDIIMTISIQHILQLSFKQICFAFQNLPKWFHLFLTTQTALHLSHIHTPKHAHIYTLMCRLVGNFGACCTYVLLPKGTSSCERWKLELNLQLAINSLLLYLTSHMYSNSTISACFFIYFNLELAKNSLIS